MRTVLSLLAVGFGSFQASAADNATREAEVAIALARATQEMLVQQSFVAATPMLAHHDISHPVGRSSTVTTATTTGQPTNHASTHNGEKVCKWGTFPQMYWEALKTHKPLIVHLGTRLDGMCHAMRADDWCHALLPEFMGHRGQGICVCLPHEGEMYLTRFFPGRPPIEWVVAEGKRPVRLASTMDTSFPTQHHQQRAGSWVTTPMSTYGNVYGSPTMIGSGRSRFSLRMRGSSGGGGSC